MEPSRNVVKKPVGWRVTTQDGEARISMGFSLLEELVADIAKVSLRNKIGDYFEEGETGIESLFVWLKIDPLWATNYHPVGETESEFAEREGKSLTYKIENAAQALDIYLYLSAAEGEKDAAERAAWMQRISRPIDDPSWEAEEQRQSDEEENELTAHDAWRNSNFRPY